MSDRFNDKSKFPRLQDIRVIQMLADGSLEVSVLSRDKNLHLHGSLTCPAGTAMHDWLINLSGPLVPGETKYLHTEPPTEFEKKNAQQMEWF